MAKFYGDSGQVEERTDYKLFGLVNNQGTCAAETVVCERCRTKPTAFADIDFDTGEEYARWFAQTDVPNPETQDFTDVTENDAVSCIICSLGEDDEWFNDV